MTETILVNLINGEYSWQVVNTGIESKDISISGGPGHFIGLLTQSRSWN